MSLDYIYNSLIIPWIILGLITFFMLFFITAPYGRHNKKMGPMMSGKWGWIIQEIISPLVRISWLVTSGVAFKVNPEVLFILRL